MQVKNLEDELVRSCKVRTIKDIFESKSKEEFKSDLIKAKNLDIKLKDIGFDIVKLWSENPPKPFDNIKNEAIKIKL
ncbi:MAG: hypothetical protein RSB75_04250 [Anaerovoracaceae bacterium]